MPSSFSAATRSGRARSDAFASGATGTPRRPITVGRPIRRSRRVIPRASLTFARAWELICAIFTPCGQTWVQIPQPEQ